MMLCDSNVWLALALSKHVHRCATHGEELLCPESIVLLITCLWRSPGTPPPCARWPQEITLDRPRIGLRMGPLTGS
jgi:hypothetical protein